MTRMLGCAALAVGMASLVAGGGPAAATTPEPADIVYLDANIVTMDGDQPTAQAVAVSGGGIAAIGTNAEIRRLVGPDTRIVGLDGATVLPGFIDPHSHFLGYAFFTDREHWLDVSSVNLFFKPLPDDPRCKDPTDPQVCFIPVRSQDDVIERITKAARKGKPVYAMSYDPSRLGHGKSCPGPESRVGFECPNFENGKSRATLDAISTESRSTSPASPGTSPTPTRRRCGSSTSAAPGSRTRRPAANRPSTRCRKNLSRRVASWMRTWRSTAIHTSSARY
jgi:hypothetical protein